MASGRREDKRRRTAGVPASPTLVADADRHPFTAPDVNPCDEGHAAGYVVHEIGYGRPYDPATARVIGTFEVRAATPIPALDTAGMAALVAALAVAAAFALRRLA